MDIRAGIARNKQKFILAGLLFFSFVLGFSLALLHSLALSKDFLGHSLNNNTAIQAFNQSQAAAADPNCPIKAKRKKTGKQVYHLAGDPFYKNLKQTDCFQTEDQAKAAGFSPSGTLH